MSASFVLAFDLGGTDLKSALVDEDGTVHHFARAPSRVTESLEAPLAAIVAAAARLRALAGGPVVAAGLGSPGVVHPDTGALVGRTAHLPHWDSLPLRARLEERLALPVAVDNDANLAALGEHRRARRAGRGCPVTITVGTGMGCGIVVEGRVLRGAWGGAGEISATPALGGAGPACACGVEGCIEPRLGRRGAGRRGARRGARRAAGARDVFALAAAGDATRGALVATMTDALGRQVALACRRGEPRDRRGRRRSGAGGRGPARAGARVGGALRAALAHTRAAHRARGARQPRRRGGGGALGVGAAEGR